MERKKLPAERAAFYRIGLILLALAAIDVLNFIINVAADQFSAASYIGVAEEGIVRFVIVLMLLLSMGGILLQTYLGTRAVAEAQNPTGARFHLKVAMIDGIVNLFALGLLICALFDSSDPAGDIFSLVLCLADVLLLFGYVHEGKKIPGK